MPHPSRFIKFAKHIAAITLLKENNFRAVTRAIIIADPIPMKDLIRSHQLVGWPRWLWVPTWICMVAYRATMVWIYLCCRMTPLASFSSGCLEGSKESMFQTRAPVSSRLKAFQQHVVVRGWNLQQEFTRHSQVENYEVVPKKSSHHFRR